MQLGNIQVIDAGQVPGAPKVGILVPQGRQDSLVYPQELTQLQGKHRPLYRQRKWRQYIGVESVASWAHQIEDRKYNVFIEDPVNLNAKSPTQELPMPSFSTTNQFLKIFEFGLAYGVFDREVELASKVGFSLSDENVQACNMAAENFLEVVASVGHTANGVTLKGLGNLADVTPATAMTKTGGGTAWTSATAKAEELLEDLHVVCDTCETATKENGQCNLILMPLAQMQKLHRTRLTQSERSAFSAWREERPGVQLAVWDALKTSGAGSTPCLIGYDTTSPFAPKMLMQRELQFMQALRGTNGWLVPGKLATGGVRCLNPAGVIKMSAV
jgi:hypothetical protein